MFQIYTTSSNRQQPDASLENYVTSTIMDVIANFFTSPFSQCSTAIDVSLHHHLYHAQPCNDL